MSKLSSTRSTGKSLCFPSEKEIELWNSEGKRKVSAYMKKQAVQSTHDKRKAKVSLDNQEELQFAFNSSINQLRQKTRSQKSHSSSISNRMSYLQVELKRKKQMNELAKNKYKKMIETRQKSVIEKRELTKERQLFIRQRQHSVTLQASRIRSERNNSTISVQIVRDKKQSDALSVKDQRFRNEQLIAQRQNVEKEKKRVLVENSHKNSDLSRDKLRRWQESRFRSAKTTHDLKLLEQYMRGEMQRRKNSRLVNTFKSKVKQFEEESSLIANELAEYQRLLGWHYSSRSAKKDSSRNSFYVTH